MTSCTCLGLFFWLCFRGGVRDETPIWTGARFCVRSVCVRAIWPIDLNLSDGTTAFLVGEKFHLEIH